MRRREQTPTIAAVVLNYNNSRTLHRSMSALTNQKVLFDEIIIIDDGSSDDSLEVIHGLTKTLNNVRIFRNKKNLGVVKCITLSFQKTKSEFIYFMSSQHHYSAGIVATFHNCMRNFPKAVMVSGNISVTEKNGKVQHYKLPFGSAEIISPEMVVSMLEKRVFTFFGGGNIVHRETVLRLNFFHEALKWHADWYMYLLLSLEGPVAVSNMNFSTHPIKNIRYSDSMFDCRQQWPVSKHFIEITKTNFPAFYNIFKENAVLPIYSFCTMFRIRCSRTTRDYITVKLIVVGLLFWPMRRISMIMPVGVKNKIRIWLGV